MTATHRQSIRSTIRTITLLAALTSLLLTMVTPFVGTARAEGNFYFAGYIALENGDVIDLGDPADETTWSGPAGQEVSVPGYLWHGETNTDPGGTFHLSCSQTLTGTEVTITDTNERVRIIDFVVYRDNANNATEPLTFKCGADTFADLEIEKSASTAQVSPGDSFTYSVTVTNVASGLDAVTATNVVMTDTVPSPFVVTGVGPTPACSYTNNDVTCEVGSLPANGGDFTATITVSVPAGAACGPTENVASAAGFNAAPDESNTAEVDIVNCNGAAEIIKYDAAQDGNVLTGAQYSLFLDDGDGVFEPAGDDGSAVGTCETGSATPCSFANLFPGDYWAQETAAPTGYTELESPHDAQLLAVAAGQTTTFTFVNPRLPYSIDVTPETDVNPVGLDHEFLVTATEDNDPVAPGTEIALDWAWITAPDPADPGIIEVNGAAVTATNSTTCTTLDDVAWNGGTVDGACIVTVTSYGSAAFGTLTATLDLPYQGGSGTLGPTEEGPTATDGTNLDTIFDRGEKEWRGYRVDIDEPATNLAGDPHPFTVTVWETGPGGDTLADDVIVGATWDGPTDSTVTGDGTAAPTGTDDACTTGSGDADPGQCTFTVDSDNIGTGDLTVTVLDGSIGGHAVTQTTFTDDDDVDTAKTWVAYRLWVTPDEDINQTGWDHDFDVHVQSNDGTGWEDVDGATFTAPSTLTAADGDWSFDSDLGGDLSLVDDTCDTGTVGGTCTITATSPSIGTVVLTVDGVTVPFDGGTHLTLSDVALSAGNGTDDNTGQKTWVDYGLTIGEDGVNLLGDEHPFTVTVTRDDGTGSAALPGATVNLTWDGPTDSTIAPDGGSTYADEDAGTDGVQFSCVTDGDGTCDFVVDSDTAVGQGMLSVRSITDPDVTDLDHGTAGIDYEALVAAQEIDALPSTTKTWIAVDLDIDDSATNLTGEDHTFDVTAALFDGVTSDLPAGSTLCVSISGGVGSVSGAADGDGAPCAVDEYEITSTTDGAFEVTVTSDDPGSLTVTLESVHFDYDDDGFSVELTAGSSGYTPQQDSDTSATKTWVEVDLDISSDSTNRVGGEHTFDVTGLVFDGAPAAGEDLPAGTILCVSVVGDAGSVTGAGPGDGIPCAVDEYQITATTAGEFEVTVTSDDPGSLTVTLESVHFTWNSTSFDVDLVAGSDGYGPAPDSETSATKTWIDYELAISPQDATNLLPGDPDHAMVVTLSSTGGAAIDGQTIDLDLTSDNGAWIEAVDTDGDGAVEALDPTDTTAHCTTTDAGICNVVISADTPGTATLAASFDFSTDDGDFEITSAEFGAAEGDTNGQDADKTWTTYEVDVDGPAINLLGSPHTFTVTVTRDGGASKVEGVVFGTSSEDGSYITISDISGVDGGVATIDGGTCFEEPGTDVNGQCTVLVSSTATTIATLEANYLGEASDSDAAVFTDDNTKQWIDYSLDVTPDTADNLVDTDHVFTVAVNVDLGDGDGPVAVPDGSVVDVALSGVGAIISTDGGTIDEDGLGGTCTTMDGTCQVTIRSSDAGQSSLTATFEGVATNGEITNEADTDTFTDVPAAKNWVDYELVMNEDAVNPIGTTHTFTATLTTDTGDGFGPAAGEDITFSTEGVGEVVEVENGTVDADALGGTCTTDTDGTCDITIASDEVGTTTVTALYGAVVGETSRDFADEAVKTWESNPAIDLVKEVDVTEAAIGDFVTYTYTITNTGDVTLTNVRLIDEVEVNGIFRDLLELLGFDTTITLEPGESTSLTAIHLVTEDDLPGPIDNVATVTGEAPDGEEVSDTDDQTVNPFGEPAILLDKVVAIPGVDPEAPVIGVDPDQPGDTVVPYEFTVTNTGNVTLTDVTLTDIVLTEIPAGGAPTFDQAEQVDGVVIGISLQDTTLAPNESTTGTLAYQVRAEDVDNAVVVNVAEVTGVSPSGTEVSDEDPAFVSLQFPDVAPPAPPAPVPPAAPAPKPAPAVLAVTGFDTIRLALFAALVAGLGVMLLLGIDERSARARRRRQD